MEAAAHTDAADGPDPLPAPGMRPVVRWSKHAQVNRIFRGLLGGWPAPRGIRLVGLRPGRTRLPADELRAAADTATRGHGGALARAKATFLGWQHNWAEALFDAEPEAFLVVWNGIKGHRRLLAQAAHARGRPVVYCERAPLPGRVAIDFRGVNHGCSLPRDARFYAAWARDWGGDPAAWRRLAAEIRPRAPARRSAGGDVAPPGLDEGRFVFAPLQVPGDSQLTVYGDWVGEVETMIDALAQAARELPAGWHVRVKEHPSSRTSLARHLARRAHAKLVVDNVTDTRAQIAAAAAVATVNSAAGLEAFFFDKPVLVLGHALYGFGGLATRIAGREALCEALADPAGLSFDGAERDRFMSYLDAEFYPAIADVDSGAYTLERAVARDRRRMALSAAMAG